MRRIDQLITQVRRQTENETFTATSGIDDEEFLQYANDGQDRLQSLVSTRFPQFFQQEKVINVAKQQEVVPIPSDALLGNRVEFVEFSPTGSERDYYRLKQGNTQERVSGINADPSFYIRRSGSLLLQPSPDSATGKLRLTYQKRLPCLDVRRATVSSVTLASDSITSLTLDTTVTLDSDALLEENFISIIDRNGNTQMREIEIDSIDTGTGIVTVTSGFTFEEGETIAAGNFALRGKDCTTHSQLMETAERYLLAYMAWKIFKRDSSNDSAEQAQELAQIEADILQAISEPDGDVNYVPILDEQYLDSDD